jgi:hypothetical protein
MEHMLWAYRDRGRPFCCYAIIRDGLVSEAAPLIRDKILGLPVALAVAELTAMGATVWEHPMPEPFCDFGQLPRSMCAHCLADRSVVTAVQPDFARIAELASDDGDGVGPFIEALYHGRCRGCGGRWEPGDFIAWSSGEDHWVCADCARL